VLIKNSWKWLAEVLFELKTLCDVLRNFLSRKEKIEKTSANPVEILMMF
jgi:hypothetical protein